MKRAYNKDEMQKMLIQHFKNLAQYWATTDLTRPEFKTQLEKDGETLYRLEGLLHSILCTFDGVSVDFPAFDIIPSPHPEDKKFYKECGENWWPDDVVINDNVHLHDLLNCTEENDSTRTKTTNREA